MNIGAGGRTFSSDPQPHQLNAWMTVMSPWWQRTACSQHLTSSNREVCLVKGTDLWPCLILHLSDGSLPFPRGHPKQTTSVCMSAIPKYSQKSREMVALCFPFCWFILLLIWWFLRCVLSNPSVTQWRILNIPFCVEFNPRTFSYEKHLPANRVFNSPL